MRQRLNDPEQTQEEDDDNRYNCRNNCCPSHVVVKHDLYRVPAGSVVQDGRGRDDYYRGVVMEDDRLYLALRLRTVDTASRPILSMIMRLLATHSPLSLPWLASRGVAVAPQGGRDGAAAGGRDHQGRAAGAGGRAVRLDRGHRRGGHRARSFVIAWHTACSLPPRQDVRHGSGSG